MDKTREKWLAELPDGVPCDHDGCLNHITHACEVCGRVAGKRRKYITPAPWSINSWPQGDSSISIGAKGTPIIAKVWFRDVSINEQKANARLIAAAPEMFDVLEELVLAISDDPEECTDRWYYNQIMSFLERAEKVIEKARTG